MTTLAFGSDLLKVSERLSSGIEQGESQFREFKSALERSDGVRKGRDVKTICRDIGETLVAFANADGGELFVGVEDDGTVTGVPHKEELVEAMVNAPKTHVHEQTPLPSCTVSRFKFDGQSVLYFQVAKSTVRIHLTCDGRCLQRFDAENRPVATEEIQYSRQERSSREYDREFVDGASVSDLDPELINRVSRMIAGAQSAEKFLQYVDLAEYRSDGVALRRAALLLFARDINKWHPRCQIRIARVAGNKLGVGKDYNISKREDQIVRGNILRILESAWDTLRPYLARTRLVESGIFAESLVYPDDACQEALINAIAHRDYGAEGKGIEILVYDDRLEIISPGTLLSSISLIDLTGGKRAHQSRNAYVSRVLREVGYMREMGEGMLRIFSAMKDRDLVPPEIRSDSGNFELTLHHRSVFSPRDQEWLNAYASYALSRDEQRVVLLGRDGSLLSTNQIMKVVGIADVDEFRKLVERLRRKGILYKGDTNRRGGLKSRNERRWSIRPPDQVEQYKTELLHLLGDSRSSSLNSATARTLKMKLSPASPFKENPTESLKLLGFLDERFRPLPALIAVRGQVAPGVTMNVAKPRPALAGVKETSIGKITALKTNGYGFIQGRDGTDYFFHVKDLIDRSDWERIRIGNEVEFIAEPTAKGITAKQVSPIKS